MDKNNYASHIAKRPFDAYIGDNPYIFVSYSHSDADEVFVELKRFHDDGFDVWYDEGISSGRGWQEVVEERLIKSSLLVVFISKNAIESKNVREEIFLAIDEEIPIIPIYLENTQLKYGLRLKLNSIQSILKYEMPTEDYIRRYIKDFERFGFRAKEIGTSQKDDDLKSEVEISPATFEFLNNLIQNCNGEITLNEDINLSKNDEVKFLNGIDINVDNLIIEGNNCSINAKGKSLIFNIMAKNVVIKNLCFKNANSDHGAILNGSEALSYFENCKFENNISLNDGGSINNLGEIHLKNCNFKQNSSKNDGGAIVSLKKSVLNIENSDFIRNSSDSKGGAIRCKGTILIIDSKFDSNSSKKSGGALYIQKQTLADIKRTTFIKNSSKKTGGAILNWGKTTISDSKFYENSSNGSGGAINCQKESLLKINISTFKRNHSDRKGGALFNWGEITVNDCVFEFNTSKDSGGAINSQRDGFLKVDEGDFVENTAGDKGGAIIVFGKSNVYKSSFMYNEAKNQGGAVNVQDGANAKIKDCEFICNSSEGKGGALLNFGTIDFIDCLFRSNCSNDEGGAINSQKEGFLKMINVDFIENSAEDSGGAITNMGKLKLDNSTFEKNASKIEGGAIYNKYEGTVVGANLKFTNNKSNSGGAIYSIKSSLIDLNDTEFSDNDPDDVQSFE